MKVIKGAERTRNRIIRFLRERGERLKDGSSVFRDSEGRAMSKMLAELGLTYGSASTFRQMVAEGQIQTIKGYLDKDRKIPDLQTDARKTYEIRLMPGVEIDRDARDAIEDFLWSQPNYEIVAERPVDFRTALFDVLAPEETGSLHRYLRDMERDDRLTLIYPVVTKKSAKARSEKKYAIGARLTDSRLKDFKTERTPLPVESPASVRATQPSFQEVAVTPVAPPEEIPVEAPMVYEEPTEDDSYVGTALALLDLFVQRIQSGVDESALQLEKDRRIEAVKRIADLQAENSYLTNRVQTLLSEKDEAEKAFVETSEELNSVKAQLNVANDRLSRKERGGVPIRNLVSDESRAGLAKLMQERPGTTREDNGTENIPAGRKK